MAVSVRFLSPSDEPFAVGVFWISGPVVWNAAQRPSVRNQFKWTEQEISNVPERLVDIQFGFHLKRIGSGNVNRRDKAFFVSILNGQ